MNFQDQLAMGWLEEEELMGFRLMGGRQVRTRLADLSLWCKSSSIEVKLPRCQVSFHHTDTFR